ncbi:MAG: response regulator transcription factor [Anaerolineae bacterium]|nr:response regulator transcription factor [Anaerolineae bacterium]
MTPQRIMIVDDHEVVRLGLKTLLDHQPQFEVVAEARTAKEAIEKADVHRPDVILMDIRLPGASGIEACQAIKKQHPEIKIIMLTSYEEDEVLFSAIRAGAETYLLKQIDSQSLIQAIEAVGRGEALLDPSGDEARARGGAPRQARGGGRRLCRPDRTGDAGAQPGL